MVHKRSVEKRLERERRWETIKEARKTIRQHSVYECLERETISDADYWCHNPAKDILWNFMEGEILKDRYSRGTIQQPATEPPLVERIAAVYGFVGGE